MVRPRRRYDSGVPAPSQKPAERPNAGLHFRPRHRLTHAREFQRVLGAKARKACGPLVVSSVPNELSHHRLGLAVGVRVGSAVVRNRCKRLIREAFRLDHDRLPLSHSGGYDLVVGVRPRSASTPKSAFTLDFCRRTLVDLARECDSVWRKRMKNQPESEE